MALLRVIDKYDEKDIPLYDAIEEMTASITDIYPQYKNWYRQKFLEGLKNGTRKIIIDTTLEGNLTGVALLKDTIDEKKICTLFVAPKYQTHGIGIRLLEKSFDVLHTDKPLLSVSARNQAKFSKFIKKYNFEFSYKHPNAYQKDETEFYYNNPATTALKKDLLPLILNMHNREK